MNLEKLFFLTLERQNFFLNNINIHIFLFWVLLENQREGYWKLSIKFLETLIKFIQIPDSHPDSKALRLQNPFCLEIHKFLSISKTKLFFFNVQDFFSQTPKHTKIAQKWTSYRKLVDLPSRIRIDSESKTEQMAVCLCVKSLHSLTAALAERILAESVSFDQPWYRAGYRQVSLRLINYTKSYLH